MIRPNGTYLYFFNFQANSSYSFSYMFLGSFLLAMIQGGRHTSLLTTFVGVSLFLDQAERTSYLWDEPIKSYYLRFTRLMDPPLTHGPWTIRLDLFTSPRSMLEDISYGARIT